ncbi:VOC family protein [Phenylobacterium sp.]|uniref:VOC family protein n=1 Tax=Phenylobacterium sp. TaxID=1871053 RepID=UPI002FC63EE7
MTSVYAVPERSLAVALKQHVTGIDHIAVAVHDLESAVSWYSSTLGFSVIEQRATRGLNTSMTSAVMACGSAIVVLVQGGEPDSQVQQFIDRFGPGVQHVAFSVDDLDKALESVRAAGGESDTGILQDVGIKQTFLRRDAGSGVRVELIERRGGDFTDASVEGLFRTMEARGIY